MPEETTAVRVEVSPKRVRVLFAGEYVADSRRAKLVWEVPYYPVYYLPAEDVRTDLLVATGATDRSERRGDAQVHTLKVGGREADSAALWYRDPPVAGLRGTVRLRWDAMDAWFEEDEEVYVHPRDPHKRVDVLQSSRHVRVEVDGVTVAESRQPRLLFETSLPTRYYLPKTDVRMDLLTPTPRRTSCPYKGTAGYYSVTVDGRTHDNLAWYYRHPTLESVKVAGYVCFYNEHVDLYVDGEHLPRPQTPFS
ncbi:MAG TPA: DUF427 domain-containing protein [Actinomycetes bacterium]|nr:DUF427 domain-containing protein [Actinomycetes bacterium]